MSGNVIAGRLHAIRILPGIKGWGVTLGFIDNKGNPHLRTYTESDFLAALKLLNTPTRDNWLKGLKMLGAYTRKAGLFSEVYLLKMDDGTVINLGEPLGGASGGNDIILAVSEKNLRANEIRQALLNHRVQGWKIT